MDLQSDIGHSISNIRKKAKAESKFVNRSDETQAKFHRDSVRESELILEARLTQNCRNKYHICLSLTLR